MQKSKQSFLRSIRLISSGVLFLSLLTPLSDRARCQPVSTEAKSNIPKVPLRIPYANNDLNVRSFGAKLDGTTDDTAAFNAARIAAGVSYPIIFVPPGRIHLTASPTLGFSGTDLWELSGNLFGESKIPVTGLGHDIVESFIGSKYFGRGGTHPDSGPVVRIDDNVNSVGGKFGDTTSTLEVNTNVPMEKAPLNDSAWGITSVVNSFSKGPAEHVAVVGFSYKKADGSEVWGANFSGSDTTGDNSSISGAVVGAEIDVSALGGLDDGGSGSKTLPSGSGIRVGLDVDMFEKHGATVGWGIRVNGPNVARGISVNSRDVTQAAFDTEFANIAPGANAYRLATGQTIGFEAKGMHTLGYTGSNFDYKVSGRSVFQVSNNGNLMVSGHIASSGADPAISACGSTSKAAGGSSDIAGAVSIPPGTKACTVDFSTPYSVAPFISLGQIGVNANAFVITKSNRAFTISITSQALPVEIDWTVN
jgi:hypothetical protein